MSDTPNDPARHFGCPACGHMLTFNERRCGNCAEDAPVYNRTGFWIGLALTVLAAVVLAIIA